MDVNIPKELGIYKVLDLFEPKNDEEVARMELLFSHSDNIFIEFTDDMKFSVRRIPGLPNKYGPNEHPWGVAGIQTEGIYKGDKVRYSAFVSSKDIDIDNLDSLTYIVEPKKPYVYQQHHSTWQEREKEKGYAKRQSGNYPLVPLHVVDFRTEVQGWIIRETFKYNIETKTTFMMNNGHVTSYSDRKTFNRVVDGLLKKEKQMRRDRAKAITEIKPQSRPLNSHAERYINMHSFDDNMIEEIDDWDLWEASGYFSGDTQPYGNSNYQSGTSFHYYKWDKLNTKTTIGLLLHEVRHIEQSIKIRQAITDAGFGHIAVDRIKRFLDNAYIHGKGGSSNPQTKLGKILENVETDASRCSDIEEWFSPKCQEFLDLLYKRVYDEVSMNKLKWQARVGFKQRTKM